ncbi:MAG: molybdenum cofactor guanylyltransferase [Cyclobacteriaceae bacterium]|jgi:molybdenum cofactor guanylyltransferase|nr:molybdenum cofactor guanylyltransferase [Cyclobacteriaceae bacterium]
MKDIRGLILTGGRSERFGRDKYMYPFHDKPQFQWLLDLCQGADLPAKLSCSLEQVPSLLDQPYIVDRYSQIGPIGGIASAMIEYSGPWLVIACDLPLITEKTLTKLMLAWDGTTDIVTYFDTNQHYPETTLTIYGPSCAVHIQEAIRAEKFSLRELIGKLKVRLLTPTCPEELHNANYPIDTTRKG